MSAFPEKCSILSVCKHCVSVAEEIVAILSVCLRCRRNGSISCACVTEETGACYVPPLPEKQLFVCLRCRRNRTILCVRFTEEIEAVCVVVVPNGLCFNCVSVVLFSGVAPIDSH